MLNRPRRNRVSAAVRGLVQETHLDTGHLVQPIFLVQGTNIRSEVASLPGTYRFRPTWPLKKSRLA